MMNSLTGIRAFMCAALLLWAGCSGETTAPPEIVFDEKALLQQAWRDFESGQYEKAIGGFTDVYNKGASGAIRGEAINGRAWSYSYRREFERAKSDFFFALGMAEISVETRNDLRVGYALVLHAVNDFYGVITYGNAALVDQPGYSFSHDSRISVKRIRLMLAQSYYATGQFLQAAEQMDLVDPARAPHSLDPPTLLQKITAAFNSL